MKSIKNYIAEDLVSRINDDAIERWFEKNYDAFARPGSDVYARISNGVVNVPGNVVLKASSSKLEAPTNDFKFGHIFKNFTCSPSSFKTLEGLPQFVDGDLYLYSSSLKHVDYFTEKVGGKITIVFPALEDADLSFLPQNFSGELEISIMNLKSLNGIPQNITSLILNDCRKLESLDELPKSVKNLTIKRCPGIERLRMTEQDIQAKYNLTSIDTDFED